MQRATSWRWEWVVIGLIVLVFFALSPPLILRARELQRRNACGDNLKGLMIGLQNYHDTFLYLPYGAQSRQSGEELSMGKSWLLASSPFLDGNRKIYDQAVAAEVADVKNDYASAAVLRALDRPKIGIFLCPSSPLPALELVQGVEATIPSYVGLMGADPRLPSSEELSPSMGDKAFTEGRIARGVSNGDQFSSGGMLTINESFTFAACIDGIANTVVLGETSNWYQQDGKNYRIDGARGAHWMSGTNLPGRPEFREGKFPGKAYNLTALRFPVGTDGTALNSPRIGSGDTGIAEDHGANNPLVSAHAGGVMVAFLDGHTLLLSKQTDLYIQKRLVTRDDNGGACGDD
ncbi:DUF1559 family PulG-like putative transporter [Anatilimnocola floriformis]|uniref:DUF1559 family PulG-like putative transporter n=1 Tax=Anatilimnocola floriformis TaxID=2948575 RepID=UPI0020C1C6A1|nr:DUF1559 domain-containing protein [Anatilimnocola floriformis]